MAEVKWIKIVTDIFDDEKIQLIESMPDGDGIIVIWFKLLCLAGKQNNSGVFMINDRIPYTDEMLATVFRRPISTVRLALSTFESFDMIELVNGVVTIPKWGKHQSLEKLEDRREYMRNYMQGYRSKQKQLVEGEESKGCKCLREQDVSSLDIEEDIDKDKEIDNKSEGPKRKRFVAPARDELQAFIDENGFSVDADRFLDYYNSNGWMVGKNHMKDWRATVRNWSRKEGNDGTRGNGQQRGVGAAGSKGTGKSWGISYD